MVERSYYGVGTQLKRWLWVAKLWPASANCKCERLATEMDMAGPAGVRADLSHWSREMKSSADRWFRDNRMPIKIPEHVITKMINKACDVVEAKPQPLHEQLTICVTHYKRPNDLERLLKSIPTGMKVLTQDTGGNLSWGRNQLMQACDTRFALVCEEDMQWRSDTDVRRLIQVMQADPGIGFAGGRIVDERIPWHHNFYYTRGINGGRQELHASVSNDGWRRTGDTIYKLCDLVSNFGVVRTEFARDCPWDERFELGEHRDWFLEMRKRKKRAAYVPQSRIDHFCSRPSLEYKRDRSRAKSFWKGVQDKHDVTLMPPEEPPHGLNIVVLGVGFSNTTITIRQLQALGWNIGQVDREFKENTTISDINWRLSEGPVRQEEMDAALAALPQPWAIKDPKFRDTLERWLPAFMKYQPVLLFVTKDAGTIKDSYLRRNEPIDMVDARIHNCERMYWCWPWLKQKVDATQVLEAVKMYNLEASGEQ